MEMQYYDLKIHMNIVHGDAYVPTDDDGDDDEDEDDTEDELFNSGDESEVENKKRKRKSRENLKVKGRRKRRTTAVAAASNNAADKNLEKTHICDVCGRTFRSGSELKTHYRYGFQYLTRGFCHDS